MSLGTFLHSQLFVTPPVPQTTFAGKTVIVTGSNVGLGKEAARHITRLGATTVILAVRSIEKGNAAKEDIERSTDCDKGVVKVWQLDMSSYQSVKEFAKKAEKELSRLDVALLNAGVNKTRFELLEDNEATITVNVVSTFLLALLLLPKLKETASKYNTRPNLTITSSEVHYWAYFEERNAADGKIFDTLNADKTGSFGNRYQLSKLLEVFAVRAMVERRPVDAYPVTINMVNPGLCHSELGREAGWGLYLLKLVLARTAEVGGRTLVASTCAGPESHGQYMSDSEVAPVSPFVQSQDGKITQERVWKELEAKLEKIQLGILKNL